MRIHEARSAWKSGRFEWVQTTAAQGPAERFYESCFAGDTLLTCDRGDHEGVVGRYPDGTPQPYGFGPIYSLIIGDDWWLYGEGQVRAELLRKTPRRATQDFRTLGLSYLRYQGELDSALWGEAASRRRAFKYERKAELEVVTTETDEGVLTWHLDPQRGGLPIRVTLEEDGRVVAESRSSLKNFDGVWFPERVEYFREDYRGGHAPYDVQEVLAVAINPPDLPQRLSPADIHIDAGVNVYIREYNSTHALDAGKWDGRNVLSLEEFALRGMEGQIEMGPIYRANADRAEEMLKLHYAHEQRAESAAAQPASDRASDSEPAGPSRLEMLTGWEAYIARFIDRYRLDREQTQQAIRILRNCQERANERLTRQAAEFEELERLERDSRSSTAPAAERAAELRARRERLLSPFRGIFEQQLKPGLELIPTRAQRKLVEHPWAGPVSAPSRP
jgi:hypothetical protein